MNEINSVSFKERDYKKILVSAEFKGYSMAILTLFTLAFFTVFAIRPALKSFFQVRKQIEDAKVLDQQLEDKINTLLKAQEVYTSHSYDLALIHQALPTEPQFSEFLQKFENVVNDNEATTSTFTTNEEIALIGEIEVKQEPNSIKTNNNVPEISRAPSVNFSTSLQASYPQLIKTLNALLNLRRMITLRSLDYKRQTSDENKATDTIENSMDAGAHYLPPDLENQINYE